MPKFTVTLLAEATIFTYVEVEAENKEQAEAFAMAKAPTDPQDWMMQSDHAIDRRVSQVEEDEPDE
jgi:hypothetical protein